MVGTNECWTHVTALIDANMGIIFEVEGKTFFQLRREGLPNLTRISGFPVWEKHGDRQSGVFKNIKTGSTASLDLCCMHCLQDHNYQRLVHTHLRYPHSL